MEPARTIISRFGGEPAVAELLGVAITAPYRWQYAKEKGGTGGIIPQRHHRQLLDHAAANDIRLTADDFLAPREQAA